MTDAQVARLQEYAAERARPVKGLLARRDPEAARQRRMLDTVRAFGAERGLVLFGGLAIHLALRKLGAPGLYDDAELPDYDWLSTNAVRDAYDLVERLKGPQVAAIRAIHVQTMRVRVNFVYVADIGYVPPAVLARVPILDVDGLRVVHPDFQRLDMHLAFCFPYSNAPREDVYSRWAKDADRLARLDQTVPIKGSAVVAQPGWGEWVETEDLLAGENASDLGVAFTGFAGYALLLSMLAAVGGSAEGLPEARIQVKKRAFRVGGTAPVGVPSLAASEPVLAGELCAPFLDLQQLVRAKGGACAAVFGPRRLAAGVVPLGGGTVGRLATYHHVCLSFLLGSFLGDDAARTQCRAYYAATLQLVARGRAACGEPADSPFVPSVLTVGAPDPAGRRQLNIDHSYATRMAALAAKAGEAPPEAAEPVPKNYYPPKARPEPFDYESSAYFRRDGRCPLLS